MSGSMMKRLDALEADAAAWAAKGLTVCRTDDGLWRASAWDSSPTIGRDQRPDESSEDYLAEMSGLVDVLVRVNYVTAPPRPHDD